MAYSTSSALMNFVLITLCLVFSTPSLATTSHPLIQEACSKSNETELCIQVLEAEPSVRSATNYSELCTSIILSGMSNATSVHTHIVDLLKDGTSKAPKIVKALEDCNLGYTTISNSSKDAVYDIRYKLNDIASLNIYFIGFGIRMCQDALAEAKIGDEIIVRGNKIAGIYQVSASHLFDDILCKKCSG